MARASIADFFGFVSYLLVVNNGQLDRVSLRRAWQVVTDPPEEPPPPPPEERRLLIEDYHPADYEPLAVTNVPLDARELEVAPVGAS